jgi:hypothetical protein
MTSPEPVQSVETLAYSDIAGLGQIYAAAESTTAPMATQFQALITQFLADVNTAQSSPTPANVAQVAADIQQIESLAQNGMADPNNPGDSLFLTTEMANVVGEINSSLQASGISVPVPGTGGFSSFGMTTSQFSSWYSANNSVGNSSATPPVPNGIFAQVTDPTGVSTSPIPQLQADMTASLISNQTVQALIDVEYISQGNAMIGEQMNSVSSALNALQTTITQLNSLQGLMSQIAAPASVTISTSAFNNTSATTATSYVSSVFSANENPNPILETGTAAYATFVMLNGITVTMTDLSGNPLSGSGPVQQVDLVNAVWNLEALYTELQGNGIATGTSGQINGTGPTVAGTGLAPGTTGAGFSATLPGSIYQVIQDISSYIAIPTFPPTNSGITAPIPPLVGSQGSTVATSGYYVDDNGTFNDGLYQVTQTDTIENYTESGGSLATVTTSINATNNTSLVTGSSLLIPGSDEAAIVAALGIPISYSLDDDGELRETEDIGYEWTLTPPTSTSGVTSSYYNISNVSDQSGATMTNISEYYSTPVGSDNSGYINGQYTQIGATLTSFSSGTSPWVPVDSNGNPIAYSKIVVSAYVTPSEAGDPYSPQVLSGVAIAVLDANGNPIYGEITDPNTGVRVNYPPNFALLTTTTNGTTSPVYPVVTPITQNVPLTLNTPDDSILLADNLQSYEIPSSNSLAIAAALGVPINSSATAATYAVTYSLIPATTVAQVSDGSQGYYSYQVGGVATTPNAILQSAVQSFSNAGYYDGDFYSAGQSLPANSPNSSLPWIPVDANGNIIPFSAIDVTVTTNNQSLQTATITVIGLNGQPVSFDHLALNTVTENGFDKSTDLPTQYNSYVYQFPAHAQNPSGVTMVTAAPLTLVTSAGASTSYYAIDPSTGIPTTVLSPATFTYADSAAQEGENAINAIGGYPVGTDGTGLPFGLAYQPSLGNGYQVDGVVQDVGSNENMVYSLYPQGSAGAVSGFLPGGTVTFTSTNPQGYTVYNNSTGASYQTNSVQFNVNAATLTEYAELRNRNTGNNYTWDYNSLDPGAHNNVAEFNTTGSTNLVLYPVNAQGQLLSYNHLQVTSTWNGGNYFGSTVIPVDANGNPIPGFAYFAKPNTSDGGYASYISAQSVWGYILDGQNSTGGVASAASGNNQNDLTTALTASQNVNADQQQSLQRYLFVFQEFYQSAASILTTIQDMMSKMTQGINGQ